MKVSPKFVRVSQEFVSGAEESKSALKSRSLPANMTKVRVRVREIQSEVRKSQSGHFPPA